MGRLKTILSSPFFLLLSCGSMNGKSPDNQKEATPVKLLEVEKFNSVNKIKAVRESGDTTFLISRNKRDYQVKGSEFIKLKITEVTRLRIGTMEQLGAYLIIGSDTLWSGANTTNAPKFYWIAEK